MSELLDRFADASFIDALVQLAPVVGYGFLLGIIIAIIGWVWGFVVRTARVDL